MAGQVCAVQVTRARGVPAPSWWGRRRAWPALSISLPHPTDPAADTGHEASRWSPPTEDYAAPADGTSSCAAGPGEPGQAPGVLAGVHGPHTRPGWLTRGRGAGQPDPVA
jgi:hypothetical protein